MPGARVDVAALYEALSVERYARNMSWQAMARQMGLSASTFTRMSHGFTPDVDAFATMVCWLGMPADWFIIGISYRRVHVTRSTNTQERS